MTAFRVTDMTCGGCAGRIKRSIVAMDDKAYIEFELKEQTVLILSLIHISEPTRPY